MGTFSLKSESKSDQIQKIREQIQAMRSLHPLLLPGFLALAAVFSSTMAVEIQYNLYDNEIPEPDGDAWMRRNQWEGQDYMYHDQDQDLDQDTTTMASGQYSNHILVNRKIEDKIGHPPLVWSDDWRKN